MIFSRREDEKERFKRTFAEELLQYHFEQVVGKSEDNEKQWRVLLDERIEPHAEILCDFSNWLLARGWSRETVEELFFIAVDGGRPKVEAEAKQKPGRWRSIFRLFKP